MQTEIATARRLARVRTAPQKSLSDEFCQACTVSLLGFSEVVGVPCRALDLH